MKDFLPELNLPDYKLRIDSDKIFDSIRKKWIALTPEEWVRQNFISYLIIVVVVKRVKDSYIAEASSGSASGDTKRRQSRSVKRYGQGRAWSK